MLAAPPAEAAGDCRTVAVLTPLCFQYRQPRAGCRAIPRSQVPCFTVRGRLTVGNGTPAARLWPFGTRRLLGVFSGADGQADSEGVFPPTLRAAMQPPKPGFLNPVAGVFRVCPLTTDLAGWMRPVCIDSATQVVAIARP